MAYVVPTKRGRFEIRESSSTPRGPRSRTLASFRVLSDEILEKAHARATRPFEPDELRRSARRAGAPVRREPADQAARELIAELRRGRNPKPGLRVLLRELLDEEAPSAAAPASARHAVGEWMAATPQERGKALVDLLLLADALPSGGRKGKPLRFPRLQSAPR